MKNIDFGAKDFAAKAASASRAIADVGQLRAHTPPTAEEAFMVGRTLYVWVGAEKAGDDGLNCVKPTSVPSQSPGRYRRAGLALPILKK